MRKALVLINLSGNIGGAEKRYFTLFKNLSDRDNVTLFINKNLADSLTLVKHSKIVILDFDKLFRKKKAQIYINGINQITSKKIGRFKKIGGRTKTVMKLLIGWLLFSKLMIPHFTKNRFSAVYGVWTGGIWTWPYQYVFGFKFCYSYMDSNYDSLNKSLTRFFDSEYWALKHADIVDCLSPKIAEDLKRKIKFKKKTEIKITPNSFIDYTNYYPVYPKKNNIIFLARLYPKKNPILLLEAINLLQKTDRFRGDFYVLIAGEGPMKEVLKKYIYDNAVINTNIIGFTSEPFRILQTSMIFISIQTNDNYPSQALIEAMACENAIIATNTGCTNLLISPKEGLLIASNVEALASSIEYLMNNPEICRYMGKSAREKVISTHTIDRFVEYFETITD